MIEQLFAQPDAPGQRLERLLPGKASDCGVTATGTRLYPEAVFGRVRPGSPRRDQPPAFGNWNSQFRRFRGWVVHGVFESLLNAMSDHPDLEHALIDGTIVSVHQRRQAQERISGPRHRALARRVDTENRGACRCARQAENRVGLRTHPAEVSRHIGYRDQRISTLRTLFALLQSSLRGLPSA